jgi:hypothetical protein
VNNTERFNGWTMYDNNDGKVTAAMQDYGMNVWEIVESAISDNGQSFKLRNALTGRYISNTAAPLALGDNVVTLTNVYHTKSGDFYIKVNDAAIHPVSERAATNPNTLSTGGIYPQGAGWVFEKACVISYICKDENGNLIENAVKSVAFGSDVTATAPEFVNYEILRYDDTNSSKAPEFKNIAGNKTVNVTYKRVSNSVVYRRYTVDGNHIADYTVPCAIGSRHKVEAPEIEFYTLVGCGE